MYPRLYYLSFALYCIWYRTMYRTSLVRMVSERSIIVHVRHRMICPYCCRYEIDACTCTSTSTCRLSFQHSRLHLSMYRLSFHCTLFKFTPLLDMPAYIHEHAFIPTHTFAHGAICNLHSLCCSALSRPGDTRRRRAAGAAGLLLARSFPKHEAAASTLCRPLTGPRWCRPRTPPPRAQAQRVAA